MIMRLTVDQNKHDTIYFREMNPPGYIFDIQNITPRYMADTYYRLCVKVLGRLADVRSTRCNLTQVEIEL
jgi:hypothetical protein